MLRDGHRSPEQAALFGFPLGAVHIVASRQADDVAFVLLDASPHGWRYLYGVNCERVDGQWTEGGSGNGPGWSEIGPNGSLGTLTLWGEVTRDADRIRARFDGQPFETTVDDGVYLFVWWSIPCPEDQWPRLEALRVRGEWVHVSSTLPN